MGGYTADGMTNNTEEYNPSSGSYDELFTASQGL
jgi:hypothetical protein